MLQFAQTSFSNYEDSILTSGFLMTEESINIINQDYKDTYGIGFWSMSIPLQIPKRNFDIDIPYDDTQQETGEMLLLVKDSDTNDYLFVVSKILDYPNQQVQHMIKFFNKNSHFNFFYNFNALEYEGIWIFHLILIQPINEVVLVEVSNQSKQSHIFASEIQKNLKIFQGGRGQINDQNLNTFRGLLSKLIFLPYLSYSENSFQQIQLDNQIPQKYQTEQKIKIIQSKKFDFMIPDLLTFDGYSTIELVINQYGKSYCLSGWVKYNFQNSEADKYILMRMTGFINYEDQKKLGDDLFSVQVFFSKIQPQKTKIVVHADAYSIAQINF